MQNCGGGRGGGCGGAGGKESESRLIQRGEKLSAGSAEWEGGRRKSEK
jgi:hypothetical protein